MADFDDFEDEEFDEDEYEDDDLIGGDESYNYNYDEDDYSYEEDDGFNDYSDLDSEDY
jgi:hypothetical protein